MPLSFSNTTRLFPVAIAAVLMLSAHSCKKYEDTPGKTVPELSRKYCNDPEAVNFNRDFPGTADNSVCIYPADAFRGSFSFTDSIYGGANNSLLTERPLLLTITSQSRTRLTIAGLCGTPGAAVALTASRTLRATVDTTVLTGQQLCRTQDTVSGAISELQNDSTRIRFMLTVVSDTGVTTHRGTAYRQ